MTISQLELLSDQILTPLSDSKSLNTLLVPVRISSNNEHVFICDLSDLTSKIKFDAWWASRNVGSNHSSAWNDSRHTPLWHFYLHCGIKETGNPRIICIIRHHFLCHPSDHVTRLMGKHMVGKVHDAKLYKLTDSEVTELTSSKVDEIA